MSTLRNSCGTLDHSAATWVLSVTSSCTETIFPPSFTPAALCAASAASATFSSWSARRATRIKFEPAYNHDDERVRNRKDRIALELLSLW